MKKIKYTPEQLAQFKANYTAILEINKDTKEFFVTNDLVIHNSADKAVQHAAVLSAGNPEVETVNRDGFDVLYQELANEKLPVNETGDDAMAKKKAELQKAVDHLKERISKFNDGKRIDEQNINAKTALTALEKQLADAEEALKNLQ